MKVMITGHRPDRLGGYNELNPIAMRVKDEMKKELRKIVDKNDNVEIISGMALGADQWFAEIGYEMGLKIHSYLPFVGQEKRWDERAQKRYWDLVVPSKVKIVGFKSSRQAYFDRNEKMAEDCDIAIAVWDGQYNSGTGHAIKHLLKLGKEVIIIHP